jgi:hypothetical protein
MDRDMHPADREGDLSAHLICTRPERSGTSGRVQPEAAQNSTNGPVREPEHEDELRTLRPVRIGRQIYSISHDEIRTMYDIGRFRVVRDQDLVSFRYRQNEGLMKQDVQAIFAQGLIEKKTVWTGRNKEVNTFIALTKSGKTLLKRQDGVSSNQALYTGFVKPAELHHDAAIYPVFQREAAQIEKDGGRIRRVVLDYELKKRAYSPLAKAKALPPAEFAKQQAEIARQFGLKVINGHLTLPDLRIEYETRSGVATHIDLEVATKDYHGSHAAEKAAAGFKIYAAPDVAGRLNRVLEEREITAEILCL